MLKTSNMVYKTLVVGVIVLFIGVGIQPAIAISTDATDNEDDCNLCAKKVSKSHLTLLKNLLNRVKKYDNILSVLSRYNPEFVDKYQELSNRLKTLKEINKEFKSNIFLEGKSIICFILGATLLGSFALLVVIREIQNFVYNVLKVKFLAYLSYYLGFPCVWSILKIIGISLDLYDHYDCGPPEP